MKIYIITKGHYSDYHIITATTDKKTANKLLKLCNVGETDDYFKAKIEEYEDKEINSGLILYECSFQLGWKSCSINPCEYPNDQTIGRLYCTERNYYYLATYAKDEEHAKKIFHDKLMEHKAKKEGLV